MKRGLIVMAFGLFALCCRGQGTFQVTFEGYPYIPDGANYGAQRYYEDGLVFTPIDPEAPFAGFTRQGRNPGEGWPDNGTACLLAGLTDTLKFSSKNNSLISVLSVDLACFSQLMPDFMVQFVGYRPDGTTVTETFSGSGLNFRTFYFNPEFSGLSRVEIPTYGWSLDNLVVAVPEPSVGALMILGAGFLGLRIRRQRQTRESSPNERPFITKRAIAGVGPTIDNA